MNNLAYDRARHSLILDITGPVTITTRSLKNPPRLVVDMPAASLVSHNRELEVHDDLIHRVRLSQWKIYPPTVRVVVETATTTEPLIAVQQTSNKLYITLAPARPVEEGASPVPGASSVPAASPQVFTPPPTARPTAKPATPKPATPRPTPKPTPVHPAGHPTPTGWQTPRALPMEQPTPHPTVVPHHTPRPFRTFPPMRPKPSPITRTRLVPKQPSELRPRPTPTPEVLPSEAPVLEIPRVTPSPARTPDSLLQPSAPPEPESLPQVP